MGKNQTQIEISLEDGQVVGATTRVNAQLDSIDQKAKALGQNTGFESFGASVKQFIEDPLHSAGNALEGLLSKIGPSGAGIAAGAAAFTALGAAGFESMEKLASLGRETENISLKMGLSTKEVGQFTFAAKAAGGDVSTLERLMRGLTMAVEGTDAKSEHARETLRGMGVDVQSLRDGTASTSSVLLTISEHLNGMANVWERNQVALDLFKRSGIDAIPVLMGLNENVERAKELGLGISDAELEKFKQYHQQLLEIGAEWDVLKRKMMEGIVGPISFVLHQFAPGTVGGMNWDLLTGSGPGALWHTFGETQSLDLGADLSARLASSTSPRGGMDALVAASDARIKSITSPHTAAEHLAAATASLRDAIAALTPGVSHTQAEFDAVPAARADVAKWQAAVAAEKAARGDTGTADRLGYFGMFGMTGHHEGAELGWGNSLFVQNAPDIPEPYNRLALYNGSSKLTAGMEKYAQSGYDDYVSQQQRMAEAGEKFQEKILDLTYSEATAVEKIYQLRLKTATSQEEIQKAELSHDLKILELREKADEAEAAAADSFGKSFVEAVNAEQSGGNRGVSRFFQSQAHALEDKVIGNFASSFIYPQIEGLIPHAEGGSSFLGQLLAGTPFAAKGKDPESLKLSVAGDSLQKAALMLQAAATPRGAAMYTGSGSGGFVSANGMDISNPNNPYSLNFTGAPSVGAALPAGMGDISDPNNPYSLNSAAMARMMSLAGPSGATAAKDVSGFMGLLAKVSKAGGTGGFMSSVGSGMQDPIGILFGSTGPNGGYEGTASIGQDVGAGLGLAGAGMGAFEGISQMVSGGGAHGIAGGLGTTLMALAPLTGPAAPFVMAAGMASQFVSMLLGDPRQERAQQVNSFLEAHAYSGPDPVSYTRNMQGQDMGSNFLGNSRAVGGGTTTVHIAAMDSESFSTFLQKNGPALDNGIYHVVQNGNKSVPALRQALLGGS